MEVLPQFLQAAGATFSHWHHNSGEKTVHSSPWGIIATQNLAKLLLRTFSSSSQHSPTGPLFSHLINHLQVEYPFCIVSDAPGGAYLWKGLLIANADKIFKSQRPLSQTLLVEFSTQYPISLGEFLTWE
ncbi:hypothetical protein HJG60_010195 [Phyllostomus discolor]|uniref:Uncharacterized protein n=1 Tax=Phyllostomus discolor TaxID=89673 RepID=A0A834AZK0_9CHIR|nr:hypothetical protein HJG60_010195 [Phyllostomus discolor]